MIVLYAVGDPEKGARAKISALEDDSLRKDDAGMRFGPRYGISNGATVDFEVLAASDTCIDAIERQFVRDAVRTVHLWPGPAQNAPWPADFASDKSFNRRALRGIRAIVVQNNSLDVPFVDRPGPFDEHGEVQPVEPDVAKRSHLDVPAPSAFAFPARRGRIEVAGAAPIAVARDENFSVQVPAVRHVTPRVPQQWIGTAGVVKRRAAVAGGLIQGPLDDSVS
jgi:hypothetical protein